MVPLVIPPMFSSSLHYILPNYWPSIQTVKELKLPIMFISGRKDSLIPPEQMDRLFKEAGSEKKQMYKVKNGEHNDTWAVCVRQGRYLSEGSLGQKLEYYEKIKQFLK
mmetsp:Transcript_22078/g.19650  ORF Transcript_22078/g.19650 Transcript_22078/m.19650 type:complete len:108 (+) Transcript_22078:595-918(+)